MYPFDGSPAKMAMFSYSPSVPSKLLGKGRNQQQQQPQDAIYIYIHQQNMDVHQNESAEMKDTSIDTFTTSAEQ